MSVVTGEARGSSGYSQRIEVIVDQKTIGIYFCYTDTDTDE